MVNNYILKNMKDISVVLPCLNEEEGIGGAIKKIQKVFKENNLNGEIVVVDNNSTDDTAFVAKQFQVKYIFEPKRGYGNAYLAGLKCAQGKYIIMGDPDSSYDFNEIPRFLSYLKDNDVVLGSRFRGTIEKGAMPFLHRYVGNPGMLLLFRLLYGLKLTEPSTGFIGLRREILPKLKLKEPGMEFSSEILVRVKRGGFRLKEIPIDYYVRAGDSKLRTFQDGFRHLWFLLKERVRSI